ncbi:MAG: hypothetical protein EOO13_03370 [Chitinophagaceae bacterium]|nr:MAG: hypothetical protein EOO13_03370 [Chitinophagaceae bacterium]
MKTPIILILSFFLILGTHLVTASSRTTSLFNSNDSIFYKIELNEAEINPVTFVVVKKIYVDDNCIGFFSQDTFNKAYQFKDDQKIKSDPFIRYQIFVKRGKKYIELWTVKSDMNALTKVELDQGVQWLADGRSNYCLKIVSREWGNLSCYAATFALHGNKWDLVSKERVITDPIYHKGLGYCIDMTDKHLNYSDDGKSLLPNEIDFTKFDLIPNSRWDCK